MYKIINKTYCSTGSNTSFWFPAGVEGVIDACGLLCNVLGLGTFVLNNNNYY